MQYHFVLPEPIESVRVEARRAMRATFEREMERHPSLNWDMPLRSTHQVGVDYWPALYLMREYYRVRPETVSETIDRFAHLMAKPLLSVSIPDGQWVLHRPRIEEFVRSTCADLGQQVPINPRIQNEWRRMRVNMVLRGGEDPRWTPAGAPKYVTLMTSNYDVNKGYTRHPRAVFKLGVD